jgi:positive regulator of sigma E activity
VSYRQHVLKPSVALWAITGVLLLYSLGIVVALLILSAVVIGFGGWWIARHHHHVVVERARPRLVVERARARRQPNVVNR